MVPSPQGKDKLVSPCADAICSCTEICAQTLLRDVPGSLLLPPRACGALVHVIFGHVSSEGRGRGFTPSHCLLIGLLSSP